MIEQILSGNKIAISLPHQSRVAFDRYYTTVPFIQQELVVVSHFLGVNLIITMAAKYPMSWKLNIVQC